MVQLGHACFEMGKDLPDHKKPDKTAHMVLIGLRDEEEIEKISKMLNENYIKHHTFFEPDHDTGFTSICTEPIYGEQRKLFKKFKLYNPRF